MPKFRATLSVLLLGLSITAHARDEIGAHEGQLHGSGRAHQTNSYQYPTRFGELIFVDRANDPAALATKILLDGKPLITVEGQTDAQGVEQNLMTDDFVDPTQSAARKPGQTGKTEVYRMLVSVGPDRNCIKHFIILDFTASTPFVSKPFSYNPNDRLCERLKRIKWGKKETYIDLDGPQRYLYRTGSEIIGPIAE